MTKHTEHVEIASRFCGPPRSGNGGYVAGRIAAPVMTHGGWATVRLKAPPPLATALRLESAEGQSQLFHGDTLLGEGRRAELSMDVPAWPGVERAEAAMASYLGFKTHAFPGCFVCGPDRAVGDGLRIFPGALGDGAVVASSWLPDASLVDEHGAVRPEFVWAALDCTGAFAVFPRPEGLTCVLGELSASLPGTAQAGERCVALGWSLGGEGRKHLAGSAIYGEDGRLIGLARAVWVDVPVSQWA
jgi:hypothetical protein